MIQIAVNHSLNLSPKNIYIYIFLFVFHLGKTYALYEFSSHTVEVGPLNLIEGKYDPDLDKEYVVLWTQNGKKTAKVLATADDKGALIRKRNRLVEGKDEQETEMGKGKRAKASKHKKPVALPSSSTDIIRKYKDLQKAREQKDINNINGELYLWTLEQRVAQLERENSSLRNALSIIEGLPEMILSMERLISPPNKQTFPNTMKDNNDVAEATSMDHKSTAGPCLQSSTTQLSINDQDGLIAPVAACLEIPQAVRDRCNRVTAAKYTNDLMHGLYTTAYMAAHSVTGLGSSSKGETRPSLPPEDVRKIICEVKSVFPDKTDGEIKAFIRQTLSNSAKIMKRKSH